MPNMPPDIAYEHASTLSIQDHFDRSSGSWKQPFEGPLWSVVFHAHKKGLMGKDRKVAIIDSGFDLGIKRLKDAARGSCVQEITIGRGNGPRNNGCVADKRDRATSHSRPV